MVQLTRAALLLEQGNYSEAEREVKMVLEVEPNHPQALRFLAIIYLETERPSEGLEVALRGLEVQPADAEAHYITGFAYVRNRKLKEAEERLNAAITFDPQNAVYYSLLGAIAMDRKQFKKAEELANQALSVDPENMQALNLRARAQRNQGNKEGAYDTLHQALEREPENSQSHANLGWSRLDQGQPKQALEHFREALRLEPTNAYAKSGLVEALKARYWIYRIFLSYFMWMSKQSRQIQWVVIIGIVVGNRVLRQIIESYPELEPYLSPIIILIVVFALSTWVISPLFNLALLLNPYGKYALDKEDRRVARLTGAALTVALVFGGAYWALGWFLFLMIAIYAGLMMIPISTLNSAGTPKGKRSIRGLTIGLAALGFVVVAIFLATGQFSTTLAGAFALGVFGFQWIANFIIMRSH